MVSQATLAQIGLIFLLPKSTPIRIYEAFFISINDSIILPVSQAKKNLATPLIPLSPEIFAFIYVLTLFHF